MVKTYLKYELIDILGQITGKQCIPVINIKDTFIYCGCNDYIMKINLKTGLVERRISEPKIKSIVTCLHITEDLVYLIAGYENGNIAVYSIEEDYLLSKLFKLHKSEITYLALNNNYLASGSKDTNIFVWDIIGESALYKLTGHRDGILKVNFCTIKLSEFEEADVIISVSKDNSLKIWNYRTQECLQTLSDLIHKISNFIIFNNMIIIGSQDTKLKIYDFKTTVNQNVTTYLENKGSLNRQSSAKITSMDMTHDQKLFTILSKDSSIEFFKILSNAEIKKRLLNDELLKSNLKKREKLLNKDKISDITNNVKSLIKDNNYNYKVKFFPLFKFFNDALITGIVFLNNTRKNNTCDFIISLKNNSLECYEMVTKLLSENIYKDFEFGGSTTVKVDENNMQINKSYVVASNGHRDIIRLVKFGEEASLVLTASNESVKIWNLFLVNWNKTIELEKIALGTKGGGLYLYDTHSLECIFSDLQAHAGEITNIHPVKYSYVNESYKIVTCSSDKQIKYWNLNFKEQKKNFQRQIDLNVSGLTVYKTLDTVDQITYCMVSPDGKFIIYSLLDNSIRIFFEDTNKFYLSLYGHKLPVLSFDVSSDNTLLISGSGDKNIKIWGMDFGDCHKSIFAHGDSITCVKFVKETHYFFSSSKDKCIRYWDADTYELIYEFNDYFAEVWSLDINCEGTMMVGVSGDKSIRVYQITEEQIALEVEREKRLDKVIETDLQKEFEDKNASYYNKEIDKLIPVKKSLENLTHSEDLIESLDLAEKFREEVNQYEINLIEYEKSQKMYQHNKMKELKVYNLEKPEKPRANLFFLGKNIFKFILDKIKSISYSDLESTLNNLPYSYVQTLLFYLEYFIRNNIEIELANRCVIFVTTLFENQISNDKTIIRLLSSIKKNMRKNLTLIRDLLNFNIHSMNTILLANSNKKKSIEEYKNNSKSLEANFSFI